MKEEVWKEIEGFSRYKVSNTGVVWSTITNKEVSQVETGIPVYKYVNMTRDDGKRKLVRVHRLVALAFIPLEEGYDIVDHIDRDKFNNHVSNLRWVDRSGNGRNQENNVFVQYEGESILIVELCEKLFGETLPHYSNLIGYINKGFSIEESLEKYEVFKRVGLKQREVEFKGDMYYLVELCEKYGVNYDLVVGRLNTGWDIWGAVFNCPPLKQGIQIQQEDKSYMWFSGKEAASRYTNRSNTLINRCIIEGWTLQELLSFENDMRKDYIIDGISKKREEWVEFYETTISRVETNMKKYKISFEEAVKLPIERVCFVLLNGERMRVKDVWLKFNLEPKAANNVKSKHNLSIKETLSHFGVDTKEICIQVI